MSTDIYNKLQAHLDHMPVPFPATRSGVEIKLLKELFTREEATVALELNAMPEPAEKIYKRLDQHRFKIREVKDILESMVKKGCIIGFYHDKKGVWLYQKIPLAIGIFEFQVNRITRKISELFFQYEDEAFADAIQRMKTKQMRTIPVNVKIEPYFMVDNYDNIKEIIINSDGPFALMNCVCRQAKDTMDQPCQLTELRESCITLGNSARYMVARGVAREIDRNDLLKFLVNAKKEGLVLQPENTQNPGFICCCCGCCCAILAAARKYEKPAEFLHSNYHAHIIEDNCDGCDTCIERCQMDALIRNNGTMKVNRDRCIGCGLCISVCTNKAMRLVKKKKISVPPKDKSELYKKMLFERYGIVKSMVFAGKMAIGKKV